MLKLFPGYFLLLGLACQFGHAQRSGGGFSILSESTGPLVAEGNTSTTGFSQIGASEAIQGTFSTATTGFSGTIGFLASQPLNTLPTDLNFTAPLTIAENQPIGTIVGEFNATDPDAGATLTYHLVSGAGDTHNSLFTLDTNGTLKSATVFDYETNASTYSIRVQAKDEHNATVEGNFTVMLTDVYEPSQPNHFVDLNATVNLEMIWVEPGTFSMGSPLTEEGRNEGSSYKNIVADAETQHGVTISAGFYLGKYEVTQAQYEAVMSANDRGLEASPGWSPRNPNNPLEGVSWYDVQEFLVILNQQQADNLPSGWLYSLPTEAEWEYTYRAGTTTAYPWGDDNYSSYAHHFKSSISEVGNYHPNNWGFYDMGGNAWEWVEDWYGEYPQSPVIDPTGPKSGTYKILRGNGWGLHEHWKTYMRAANRQAFPPNSRDWYADLGFRLAFKKITTTPSNLNPLSALNFAENQPIGTIVGEFNATDPDAGATLTYHLVSGAGDGNNSLFVLETNGTLKTATTFDYETNASTYSIRVQAKDEFNATVEGNFTVTLLDLYELNYDKDSFQSTINNLPNLNVSEVFVSGNSSSLNLIGSISIPNTLEVNIQSRGDLIISGSLSMNSGQDLILEAGGDIYINGGIFSKEDSGRLFLKFGLNSTNENNPNDYFINSPVNLPDGQNLLIKQGKDGNLTTYTVLTELGVQNSLTGIDLQGVKGNLSANYALGADLNASATISWNGGSGFEPIGTASTPFSGNFEGLGHTIENLHIQRTSIDKVALFGRTFGSKISNLGVVNANIRGKREVSALIASSSNSLVSRCFSSGTVNGADENVAGLIAGIHGSTVINSYSHANATGTMYDVGGLGGELGSATIQNCYSTGKPQGGSRVGGLVGVTFSASQIQNSFWDKQTSSRTTWGIDYHGASSVAAIGLTTIEMKSQTRFLNAGWDFNNTWVMPENDYPILRWQIRNSPPANLNSTAPLTFAENQPVGTIVGEFNATDPDAGATLTYYLVSGTGDGNNSLFTLETNGTLKTATTFDYETNASTYSIRVQAKDEFNATVEGNFTVTLTDLNEPPLILSPNSVSVPENSQQVMTLSASDPEGDTIRYFLSGGPDKDRFKLNPITGQLVLRSAPDFEISSDANGDGQYMIRVSVVAANDAQPSFQRANGGENPLYGLDIGATSSPVLGDLDADGDLDMIVGTSSGQFEFFLNEGNSTHLQLQRKTGGENPLYGLDIGATSSPVLGDLDADGDLDMIVGTSSGQFEFFLNEGNSTHLQLQRKTGGENPLHGLDIGATSSPVLGDLDADGDLDMIVGTSSGQFEFFLNEGNSTHLQLQRKTGGENPLHGHDIGATSSPALGDLDADGDLDMIVGTSSGQFEFFLNEGNSTHLQLQRKTSGENPLHGHDIGATSSPALGDLDADGDLDVIVGTSSGQFEFFVANRVRVSSFQMQINIYDVYETSLNQAPTDLNFTASLTIAENQPIGTIVGEFNATDPDAGATLTYHLVSGAGDTHNSLFTLEANGTLKTATTFDYETNASTYSIRVQAKDEFNATVEGNFTVTLTDVYEPSQPNHFVDLNSSVNLEMIWVEPGTFTMGSPTGEANRGTDETEHNVTLTKGFYLGKYEVTQAQYESVMTGNTNSLSATPSQWPGNPNRPVEKVSWGDVQIFLTRLNESEQAAGRLPAGWSYVLPTESQWEYACRAGTSTAYFWGATIANSNANYNWDGGATSGNDFKQTLDVGQYEANRWGFFDMHGNVWEWTADRYGTYPTGNPVIDPSGAGSGTPRVRRGGSWSHDGMALRSAKREGNSPSRRSYSLGFRLGFQQINNNPNNLAPTTLLTIAENQSTGSIIGDFNATDPDAGATLTYHLVSGAGDGNNSLFTLEANGTLKTATTFDFETNASTYAIRVQAKDEFNATVEGNFTVTLFDIYENAEPANLNAANPISSPRSVSNLVLWLDAENVDDLNNSTFSGGDAVSSWRDLSGNDFHAVQSNTSRQPTFQTNQINGKSAVSFQGYVGLYAGNVSDSDSITAFVVSHLPTGRAYGRYLVKRWLSSHAGGIDFIDGFAFHLGNLNTDTTIYGDSSSYPSTYSYSPTVSVVKFRRENVKILNHLVVGSGSSSPHGLVWTHTEDNIAELLVFDAMLTDQQIISVKYYLASKWSLNASTDSDGDGVMDANDLVPLDPSFHTNTLPTDLNSIALLTIAENQPIGTIVGELNATDPDAGATLTYYLVSGAGDGNNSLFTLETNGTLKTAITFDYESNASTYSIRVQAKDEFNASVEGNFSVMLTDLYEAPPGQSNNDGNSSSDGNTTTGITNPVVDGNSSNEGNATIPSPVPDYFRPIVDTLPAGEVNGTRSKLYGSVMDTGGLTLTEFGFLLSSRPNPKENASGVIRLAAESNASAFSAVAADLLAGKTYYFRAFAVNAEGIGYGFEESFATPAGPKSPTWIEAVPGTVKGWWTSPWLGNFYLNANGWARHEKLGWVFPVQSPSAGLWLWKEGFGWLWTDEAVYPFLYRNASGGWLYFYGRREETLLFYDYSTKDWIIRQDGQ